MIEPEEASVILSNTIRERIKVVANEFCKKKNWKKDFIILALGSTGTRTMTFASDVDLIFTVKNSGKHKNIQKDFQTLLGNLKKELSPFSVDCRLRPEGASSQLVWDFDKYVDYLKNRARVWEHQSFLKASLVSGNEKLFEDLSDSFHQRLLSLSDEEIIKGINDIRTKSISTFGVEMNLIDLKKNPGGLSDIEYIAHFLLFQNPDLIASGNSETIPKILYEQSEKSMEKKVLIELADNYIFIKNLEIFNQLAYSVSSSKFSLDDSRLKKLCRLLGVNNGNELKTKLNSVLQFDREKYSEIILRK
jgi:glutamine synthetase adenylyltransferase